MAIQKTATVGNRLVLLSAFVHLSQFHQSQPYIKLCNMMNLRFFGENHKNLLTFTEIFSSFFRAVVLSRRCLNNESEYITLCPTCQHYFAYFSNNFAKAVKKPIIMGFFVILDLIVFSLFLIIYSIYAYKS